MVNSTYAGAFRRIAILFFASLVLSGCLTEGEVDSIAGVDGDNPPTDETSTQHISGSVGDGPIIDADVHIRNSDGSSLQSVSSDSGANFDVVVDTDSANYPLTILAVGGTDLVTMTNPDFELRSIVANSASESIANLNPFTSVAYEAAVDMNGGATAANVNAALQIVFAELNSGLTTLSGSQAMTAQIGATNIAEMLRASEALGEVVRRTRNSLSAVGRDVSGNGVVIALGSDLSDGNLDGRGGPRTDARLSAVAGITLAQVSLETMQNRLRVHGSDAMGRIGDAMAQVVNGTPNPGLSALRSSTPMVESVQVGLLAANAMQTSTQFSALLQEANELQAGMTPADVRQALSVDITAPFDALLITVAGASSSDIDKINNVLRTGESPQQNAPPAISGTPDSSVNVGMQYRFVPTASDGDDDPLTFSVSGLPGWASFDISSGEVSGVPTENDVGTSSGVVISVSDGQASDSLPPFSVTVSSVDTNSPPTISGSPGTAVLVGNSYLFTPGAQDPDGDTLTFNIVNRPSWADFDAASGRLSGIPSVGDVGTTSNIVISVTDGNEAASLAPFGITVEALDVNSPPQISGTPAGTVVEGEAYTFRPNASDSDGDALTFSIANRPGWASFSSTTGRLSGVPQSGDVGTWGGIVISVSDGEDSASVGPFSIVVEALPENNAPVISGSPAGSVRVGIAYDFQPAASDADDDVLTFGITNRPSWTSFDTATGQLSGTPQIGDIGTTDDIVISVTDGEDTASLAEFSIDVLEEAEPSSYVGFGSATLGAGSCPTGMTTYRVTSLSGGSGSGTLRDAVSQDCRHIEFDVAGNIPIGDLQISKSYLTIDGSSAPSPGITLTNVGRLVLEASGSVAVHDVIVNNIRAVGQGGATETNDLWELDGSSGAPIYRVVLDHLTMIGSADGNVDIYGDVHDITLSNSLIMDSIQGQHYSQSGGLRERITVVGNVYARLNERQPRIRYNTRQVDFVGNVIYGWGWFEGGASGMHIDVGSGSPSVNVEQNVYHYVSGLDGGPDDALRIDDLGGLWFFANNIWPTGESQGDNAGNSSRISMVHNGVDFAVTRERADIPNAGTHFPTPQESDLLATIASEIADGSGGGEEPPPPPPGPSAYRGIPEPSDMLGFDVWADYTADQVVTGNQGDRSLSCNGTAADPCVIDASSATFTKLTLSGSYVILQGGLVNAPEGSGYWMQSTSCTRCVIRDVEVAGPRFGDRHSSAVGLGQFNVWIRGSVHGFGDNRPEAPEQDYHGFKVMGSDIWILDAEIYDNSGDSVQVGDASRGSAERVYMGGGYYHHNRENAVDIKDSRDIVVSGVLMEGFRPTSSDPGSALVVHDDAYDARIYDNIVRDSQLGMVSSGRSGHIIDGNNIQALDTGIELRNTQNITVTNNTISAPTPINVQGGVTGTVQGN